MDSSWDGLNCADCADSAGSAGSSVLAPACIARMGAAPSFPGAKRRDFARPGEVGTVLTEGLEGPTRSVGRCDQLSIPAIECSQPSTRPVDLGVVAAAVPSCCLLNRAEALTEDADYLTSIPSEPIQLFIDGGWLSLPDGDRPKQDNRRESDHADDDEKMPKRTDRPVVQSE